MDAVLQTAAASVPSKTGDPDMDAVLHQTAPQTYSPIKGMSNYDLAAAGAGKSVIDTSRGIRQIIHNPFPGITIGSDPQEEIDEAKRLDQPLMATTPGKLGYVGGSIATQVIPAGLAGTAAKAAGLAKTGGALSAIANPSTYGSAAASGALMGALQPTATGESRTLNTLGGAAAGAAGQGLAKGVSAVGSMVLEPAANKAVEALQAAGVPLDAAQRTGSILLQRAKAMLSDNPLTAGAQRDFQDMQQKAVNRAFLSTIGETANAATPDVMGRAMTRMGKTYDAIADRVNVPYDNIEAPLSDIMNNARLTLNDTQFSTIQRNADDILQKASQNNGVINGLQFQNIKKTLDRLSSSGDSDVAEVARDMRQSLHDGLLQTAVQSGNTADATLLKQTNQQWRNMRTIESAIDKQGSGDISPARLANVMGQKANRSVSIYGKGDTTLSDLAQSANALLPNKTPNSGTPSRLIAQATLPLVGAGLGAAKGGDWQTAAEGATLGVALPKLLQMGLNSQATLGKGAMAALGSLGAKTKLPELAGGALQHSPLAAGLALQPSLLGAQGKPKPESENP
jgi:hypothetical protein